MRGDGDGWISCDLGHQHWGRFGAAGVLVRDRGSGGRVVLQHRAPWGHEGGTWGVPGGARDSDEPPVAAALREATEEANLDAAAVLPVGLVRDDHGGWSYVTVVAEPIGPLDPRPASAESTAVEWVRVDAVDALPLHPGFASTWPRLRAAPGPLRLVVDAANVVGALGRGDGWWRDRAGATRRLRAALTPLASTGIAAEQLDDGPWRTTLDTVFPQVILVVEGVARTLADDLAGAVEVRAARGSGDDAVVVAAREEPAATIVITADRQLRDRVRQAGARYVGPSWLTARL